MEIEERQRGLAREREEKGEAWAPKFFEAMDEAHLGKPRLRKEGEECLKGMEGGVWVGGEEKGKGEGEVGNGKA